MLQVHMQTFTTLVICEDMYLTKCNDLQQKTKPTIYTMYKS